VDARRSPVALAERVPLRRQQMPTTVLVVDDYAETRAFLATVLQYEGYAVEQASDGQAALHCLRGHSTGLVVLLDLYMPVLSGFDVLRTVDVEAPLHTRHAYIVMSAQADSLPDDFARLLMHHSIPVFVKPFAAKKMLAAVAAAAERLHSAP
jgi:CheY-like chemotaxis protein